jgi:hypothetical protein
MILVLEKASIGERCRFTTMRKIHLATKVLHDLVCLQRRGQTTFNTNKLGMIFYACKDSSHAVIALEKSGVVCDDGDVPYAAYTFERHSPLTT